jgi:hypothetical protein
VRSAIEASIDFAAKSQFKKSNCNVSLISEKIKNLPQAQRLSSN